MIYDTPSGIPWTSDTTLLAAPLCMGQLFNEAIPVAIVLATMSKALSPSVALLLSSMVAKAASVLKVKWVIASV